MSEQPRFCRSTAVSMRYWTTVALLVWTALSLIGLAWPPLRPAGAVTILLAMSIACFANWIRNRTCHCAFSAPLLLIAAGVFLLHDLRIIHLRPVVVWVPLCVGLGIAFVLEWRLARASFEE